MLYRRKLSHLPASIFSLVTSPFNSSQYRPTNAPTRYMLLQATHGTDLEHLASDDEPSDSSSSRSTTKSWVPLQGGHILARVYRNFMCIWFLAFLGTLSLGSIILYGGFVLLCLYNGFWPSIVWARATSGPIVSTDLAGVYPIACHSHNDYWRQQPLATALLNGCISVEADLWLHNGQILVGHTQARLSPNRTLSSLYIDPLLQLLHQRSEHVSDNELAPDVVTGIFESDPSQSLTLLLDFKSDDPSLWEYVHRELEPLRRRRYLTYFDGTNVSSRAVTVVVSGSAPFSKVAGEGHFRDIFFDAPLGVFSSAGSEPQSLPDRSSFNKTIAGSLELRYKIGPPTNAAAYSSANSYYASGNFKRIVGNVWHSKLSDQQLSLIRAQIKGAHARGLKVRYWGVPSWPLGIRNYLWRVLIREGVDVLSVENVRAVAHDNWGPRKGGCMSGDLLQDGSHYTDH